MENLSINLGKVLTGVQPGDNIDLVIVPEPEEVVREREFNRRLENELKFRVADALQMKLEELEPVRQQEREDQYEKGYIEGFENGRQEELHKIAPLKQRLSETIEKTVEFRDQITRESEKTIVEMALNFARVIVGREIQSSTDIVRNQVKKALEFNISEAELQFHINPEDIGQFDDMEEFIPEEYLNRIRVIPDESVDKGGCMLNTNAGIIDATIKAQLAELEANIRKGLETDFEPGAGTDS